MRQTPTAHYRTYFAVFVAVVIIAATIGIAATAVDQPFTSRVCQPFYLWSLDFHARDSSHIPHGHRVAPIY